MRSNESLENNYLISDVFCLILTKLNHIAGKGELLFDYFTFFNSWSKSYSVLFKPLRFNCRIAFVYQAPIIYLERRRVVDRGLKMKTYLALNLTKMKLISQLDWTFKWKNIPKVYYLIILKTIFFIVT